MLNVYRDVLPDSYLLIPFPLSASPGNDALARSLHRASRSGKPAIWVDCSMLDLVSADEADLLLAYDYQLRRQQRHLILCHVSGALEQQLAKLPTENMLCVVPTMLDAASLGKQRRLAA